MTSRSGPGSCARTARSATSGATRTPRSRLTASSSRRRGRTSSSRSTRRARCAGRSPVRAPLPGLDGHEDRHAHRLRLARSTPGRGRRRHGRPADRRRRARRPAWRPGAGHVLAYSTGRSALVYDVDRASIRLRTPGESRRESSPGRATAGCCSSSHRTRRRSTTCAAMSSPRTTPRMRRSTSTRPSCPGPTRSSRSVRRASGVACSPF